MEGTTLLHYRILEKIGEGGMGLVYKARDETLGRLVAIKVLTHARLDAESRSRFLREARATSALNHPNIITIHQMTSEGGTEMIIMEYVEGRTLAQLMRQGAVPIADVWSYGVQMADALATAHAAGVIHRDIKPGNIMVTRDGLVKILDFGLAKERPAPAVDDAATLTGMVPDALAIPGAAAHVWSAQAPGAARHALTEAHVIVGTPGYMSPEQATGAALDGRTDVFSLGVVLYEMCAGRHAFEGRTTTEILGHTLAHSPAPLAEPATPRALVDIINRALQKDREHRFASMEDFRDALKSARAPEPAAPAAPSPAARLRTRRRVLSVAAAGALILALAASIPPVRQFVWAHVQSGLQTVAPSTAYRHYVAGRAALGRRDRRGEIDRAIEEFTQAVTIDAGYAPGYAGLADAYYWKNVENTDPQWKRLALDSASKAVALNADLAITHIALGKALFADGRLDESEAQLKSALDIDRQQADAHVALAFVYAARHDAVKAEASYREAMAAAPADWQPLAELGQFLYKAARYQEAIAVWEQCLRLAPDNGTVHRQLGAAYYMLDRPEDAARQFQQALEIEPSAGRYNNLGTLRYFQGKYAEAVPAFEKAVQMRANEYTYWGNLADAYRWSPGMKDKAQTAYTRAIQLAGEALAAKPGDSDLLAVVALYRVKSGQATAALRDVAAIEKGKPPSPAGLFKLTVVYELAGQREQALLALERALEAGYSAKEIGAEPELIGLRADPRFHLLMTRLAR